MMKILLLPKKPYGAHVWDWLASYFFTSSDEYRPWVRYVYVRHTSDSGHVQHNIRIINPPLSQAL
jgi:hypothetical protein